jgi:hypothetical protein
MNRALGASKERDSGLHASDADPTCALGRSSGLQAGTPRCIARGTNTMGGMVFHELHLQMKEGNRQEASHLMTCGLIVVKGRTVPPPGKV